MHANLYAYTPPATGPGYVPYLSLNRQADGSVTLTVRSANDVNQSSITLPNSVMLDLADALNDEALRQE